MGSLSFAGNSTPLSPSPQPRASTPPIERFSNPPTRRLIRPHLHIPYRTSPAPPALPSTRQNPTRKGHRTATIDALQQARAALLVAIGRVVIGAFRYRRSRISVPADRPRHAHSQPAHDPVSSWRSCRRAISDWWRRGRRPRYWCRRCRWFYYGRAHFGLVQRRLKALGSVRWSSEQRTQRVMAVWCIVRRCGMSNGHVLFANDRKKIGVKNCSQRRRYKTCEWIE